MEIEQDKYVFKKKRLQWEENKKELRNNVVFDLLVFSNTQNKGPAVYLLGRFMP